MAGIYIHIPFCKRACHYCNFHFTTSTAFKSELINAICKETVLQKSYLEGEMVATIYIGGGTPSLCSRDELQSILDTIRQHFPVSPDAEITIEVNPDDISSKQLADWKDIGINRLSIGVQSFFEENLQWMNRAHNAEQALNNVELACQHFDNLTIDLIYGTPQLTDEKWKQNVHTAIAMQIPHLSCYALTVEPKTPLEKMIRKMESPGIDNDKQSAQFLLLMEWMNLAGYEHYEISNFAKPGHRSRHNYSYWQGKHYLGLGPSAHSFNGTERQWNIANNNLYIQSVTQSLVPAEKEILSPVQKVNELIMISLRTSEGLDLDRLDTAQAAIVRNSASKYIKTGKLMLEENRLTLTNEGKLLADGIASDFFF